MGDWGDQLSVEKEHRLAVEHKASAEEALSWRWLGCVRYVVKGKSVWIPDCVVIGHTAKWDCMARKPLQSALWRRRPVSRESRDIFVLDQRVLRALPFVKFENPVTTGLACKLVNVDVTFGRLKHGAANLLAGGLRKRHRVKGRPGGHSPDQAGEAASKGATAVLRKENTGPVGREKQQLGRDVNSEAAKPTIGSLVVVGSACAFLKKKVLNELCALLGHEPARELDRSMLAIIRMVVAELGASRGSAAGDAAKSRLWRTIGDGLDAEGLSTG
mmetsp:Transcript_6104/g.17065  ORF Transcript_6104/g.17065 Transcript_6104/m.17065 type:complete len:273 (+) Transcript_6104:537-1355(+)